MNRNVLPKVSESPTVSLLAAGRALGISRSTTYAMHRRGSLPVPVIELGGQSRVPTAALRRVLALDVDAAEDTAEDTARRLGEDPALSEADRYQLALLLIGDKPRAATLETSHG